MRRTPLNCAKTITIFHLPFEEQIPENTTLIRLELQVLLES